jgi:hypothetical protein
MGGIFGSSGKTVNPAGTVGSLVGAIGAAFSAILWIYHFNPDSTLLGKYSQQLAAGGQMSDQMRLLAFVFGAIAVVLGIVAGLGGKGGSTTVMSILLGIAALSYPILTALNVVKQYVPNPIGG